MDRAQRCQELGLQQEQALWVHRELQLPLLLDHQLGSVPYAPSASLVALMHCPRPVLAPFLAVLAPLLLWQQVRQQVLSNPPWAAVKYRLPWL